MSLLLPFLEQSLHQSAIRNQGWLARLSNSLNNEDQSQRKRQERACRPACTTKLNHYSLDLLENSHYPNFRSE
jgi:hypothetical protein